MFVSIDLCLVSIGVGTSLSPYIKECIEVIKNEGLNYELGANGTAIEGDWDEVFECVRKCHEKIYITYPHFVGNSNLRKFICKR